MKLQAKISILFSIILGVFVVTFLLYQYIRLREKKILYQENQKSQELVIDKVLQLSRIKYEQLINDNSGWDEMVDFAISPDSVWAKDNVDFFVNSFHLNFVQVYSKEKKLIYQFGDSTRLQYFGSVAPEAIQQFFSDTAFVHYFTGSGENLLEVFGATIVPAADTDTRLTPPQGYLLIARRWDSAYIGEHSAATSYQAELISTDSLAKLKKDPKKYYIVENLTDYSGKPVAAIVFSKRDALNESMTPLLYLSVVVTIIAVISVFIFLYYFRKTILAPVQKINKTLDSRNPAHLDEAKANTEEFKRLEELILKFFQQEDQLKRKNAELKENNAMKDRLFSIIAHDLKNPVGNMQTITELLTDCYRRQDTETMEELLEMLNSQAKETMTLLETLFEWAKSQSGQISYSPEELDLRQVVKQVAEVLQPGAGVKGITLETEIDPGIKVFADRNMIHTVLRNLISNAIKFTFSGGTVQISAKLVTDGVEVSVKDDGIGMNAHTVKSLFHIDGNATTNGTAGEKGSGLGLIICREFIEKHGREIHVSSRPREGSRFSFSLPAA
ncbi:MAG: hypothetical protein JNK09_09375 [Prolixibacteraceae bacterium]|nr:hypothetical protein [Prolixibacteraceae bacterium]